LLLQARSRDERYDAEKVSQVLAARGVLDGRWKLEAGEVEVSLVREGDAVVATSIGVPLTDRDELLRAALAAASQVAVETEVRLIDPQLAADVAERDAERVAEQFGRTARYAGEMLGLPEAVAASFGPPPESGMSSAAKVVLGLGAFLVFIYLVLEKLLTRV
jgi:hypothetical protein